MSNKNYWNKRVASNKHTGWADEVIYAFDQAARLNVVQHLLNDIQYKERVFDFGGGTGDFTQLLITQGAGQVDYFDISDAVEERAKKRFSGNNKVVFLQDFIRQKDVNAYDLGISVTVLDHILADEELYETIAGIAEKIRNGGYFIFFEYTKEQDNGKGYQRFSSFDFWIKAFSDNGFEAIKSYGFYHPQHTPVNSFLKFRQRAMLFKKIRLFRFFKTYLKTYAQTLQRKLADFYWPSKNDDVMSVILFKRK